MRQFEYKLLHVISFGCHLPLFVSLFNQLFFLILLIYFNYSFIILSYLKYTKDTKKQWHPYDIKQQCNASLSVLKHFKWNHMLVLVYLVLLHV